MIEAFDEQNPKSSYYELMGDKLYGTSALRAYQVALQALNKADKDYNKNYARINKKVLIAKERILQGRKQKA